MKKFFAEFIGTFVLVLFACGTATVVGCDGTNPNGAYVMTALAFGLVIVAMAYSIGNVSGCHINPAVSLGVLLTGGMSITEFFIYIVAQFAGATAGAAVLGALVGFDTGLGANALYDNNIIKSLIIECILTFVFVLVILSVTSKKKYEKFAGLVIGLTLTLVHIFGIYFTGTSVNPARSFGPAILKGGEALSSYWVFLVAPLVGGALAAVVFKALIKTKEAE
ncbi:MIP/aquaporin family protein [Ruminococcus sp.]|uniref:MIP/aquaporin family protein n=1 Tax=Ruminococcus sp. TaxID=41978 RepID=UPI0038904D09